MLDVSMTPDQTTRKQAIFLAEVSKFTISESDHNAVRYGELLCHLLVEGTDEKSISFLTVSRFVLDRVYKIRDSNILKRMAINALAIIHQRGELVGDIEEDSDIKLGHLAKIKDGKPLDLTPTQILNLAVLLRVPIGLFFEDYDNNPIGLRQAIDGISLSGINDVVVKTEDNSVHYSAPETPFGILAAEILPELSRAIKTGELIMSDTALFDSGVVSPDSKITQQVSPATVVRNIRAAAKRAEIILSDLLMVIGVSNRRHFENVEKGEVVLTLDELTKFALKLGVEVDIFYTGEGLERFYKRPKSAGTGSSLVPVGAKKLILPPLSSENRDDFFRDRCLHNDVEVTDGHRIGELLTAARSRDPIDWYTLWLSVTVEGVAYQKKIDGVLALTKPWGVVMKVDFISALHTALWPSQTN